MTDSPLFISFLWHMHQPFYKDPFTRLYRLPWVRLHGTKDYLDMLEILREFPHIKQTFNFTPSLLEQLTDYTDNNSQDSFMNMSLKKATELNQEEKIFILENFFLANWDNMIGLFDRYRELLRKRGSHLIKSELNRIATYFNAADFLDLQVLFNLSWIDPLFRGRDPLIKMLVEKGRNFSEEDKLLVISKQFSILKEIIPAYREGVKNGHLELSCSPFYHPILPLLVDTNSAKVALPDVKLPSRRFSHPEDASEQIRMGIEYFEKTFGYRPSGMWPSEGSVSEDVLRLISKAGIKWIATDEDILSVTLGKPLRDASRNVTEPDILYRPYLFENVSIVFRDHNLSDLIGFVYSKWDARKAADDLINKLLQIRAQLPKNRPHLLSIILDGENAWEYYKNDGIDFLRYLYEGISKDERLQTITVSEYLDTHERGTALNSLHAGSWIYANYAVWIGHEEDNTAWDYLSLTRDDLVAFQNANPDRNLSEAWKSLYIAEGSDWNWWYGDEHTTETQKEFDELFRLNLMNVYKEIGQEIPDQLFVPVLREDKSIAPTVLIRGFIDPKIDGIVTSYYEWYQGAQMDIKKSGGSMHKAESVLSNFFYGFNKDTLFLRLDLALPKEQLPDDTRFTIHVFKPLQRKIIVSIKPDLKAELFDKSNGDLVKIKDISDVAFQDIFEIGILFSDLGAQENNDLTLSISITKNGEEIERCPWRGYITITAPSPEFEAMLWY